MYYDDFEVGQRFETASRTLTEADLADFTRISGDAHPIHWDADYCADTPYGRPIFHGPFGIAMTFGLLHDLGVFDDSVVAMRAVDDWEFHAPLFVGDEVTLEMLITRCRVGGSGRTGTVNRWLRLVNQDAVVVQEGMSPVLLRRRDDDVGREPVLALDFASRRWADLLARRLDGDEKFQHATADFDGAIGFRAGAEAVHLRVLHGRVLECGRRSDAGRRFVVGGAEPQWVDFVFSPRNDFIARATKGEFDVDGDVYEYLRMTKALHQAWEHIRSMAREARRS